MSRRTIVRKFNLSNHKGKYMAKDDDYGYREPEPLDRRSLQGGPLGTSAETARWRKSPAGQAYLSGVNGNTIMPPKAKPAG